MKVLEVSKEYEYEEKILENISWSIRERCVGQAFAFDGCNSLLLVEEDDLFYDPVQYYAGVVSFYSFKCPVCGKKTSLRPFKVPVLIQNRLTQKNEKAKIRTKQR